MPPDNRSLTEILLWAGAAGTIAAAVCSSLIIALNGWRQRVAENRRHTVDSRAAEIRHFRELGLEAAIAEWKQAIEDCRNWTPTRDQMLSEERRPVPESFDYILLKKIKMMQTFGDGTIATKDLPAKWAEMAEFYNFIRDRTKTKKPKSE